MRTTLNKIREHIPCKDGWEKLLKHLGKTKADDEPLSIDTIIDSNGLDDALWCLRAVEGKDREIRMYAVWCARQVQHLLKDQRSIEALDVAERYANGEATQDELNAAADATAGTAADATAGTAADAAAWSAARAAAAAAAWSAARYAVAYDVVRAVWNAAWAARAADTAAARSAAGAAAGDAAAAYAADTAADAAAWAAARENARAKQEAELRRICEEG